MQRVVVYRVKGSAKHLEYHHDAPISCITFSHITQPSPAMAMSSSMPHQSSLLVPSIVDDHHRSTDKTHEHKTRFITSPLYPRWVVSAGHDRILIGEKDLLHSIAVCFVYCVCVSHLSTPSSLCVPLFPSVMDLEEKVVTTEISQSRLVQTCRFSPDNDILVTGQT